MESWHFALVLRPFFTAALLIVTGALIVYPLKRFLPEGRLKQALLWRTTRARGWQHFIVWGLIIAPWFYIAYLIAKVPSAF